MSIIERHPSEKAAAFAAEGRFTLAAEQYISAFNGESEKWWWALEALRNLKMAALANQQVNRADLNILFSPDYKGNSYQKNLYLSAANGKQARVCGRNKLDFDEQLVDLLVSKKPIYHQHWVKEIYWSSPDWKNAKQQVVRHISIVRALKAFGVKIVWTIHNLSDHDAAPHQQDACLLAMQQMNDISDLVLVHDENSLQELSKYINAPIKPAISILPHSLYTDLLECDSALPGGLSFDESYINIVNVGMTRPYKGVPNLISAFATLRRLNPELKLRLILAGRMYDPLIDESIAANRDVLDGHLVVIDRHLKDSEMASIMRIADLSVTPYQKILISGSYYLATTFGVPTIAPAKGMFAGNEAIALTYDGSLDGLVGALRQAISLGKDGLKALGERANAAHAKFNIEGVSTQYLSITEGL